MTPKMYYVYILTNRHRTVLYVGVTNNLERRLGEHYRSCDSKKTFCGRYNVYYLLYYSSFQYINNAIRFEKEIKGWTREKKLKLIKAFNPSLQFLNKEVFGKWPPEN